MLPGYGSKLANIFSTKFLIEVYDAKEKKLYQQQCSDNLSKIEAPVITKKSSGKSYTKITFWPDWARFQMTGLDQDTYDLLCRRVVDVAGTCADSKLKVTLNGNQLKFKSFEQYCQLYVTDGREGIFKVVNERWQVFVTSSTDGQFFQNSFVNHINTSKGGSHVQYVVDQLVESIKEACKKKNKQSTPSPSIIKNHLVVFINCLVENPSFDSQTKVNLTSKRSSFGSTCDLDKSFLSKLSSKLDIVDDIIAFSTIKDERALKKQSAGRNKKGPLRGIQKLDDANYAGDPKHVEKCTLYLVEGMYSSLLESCGVSGHLLTVESFAIDR